MQYPRVIQEIHQIEVTTQCNLRCKYCPHPKMQRPKEHMTWETFRKALDLVKYYDSIGTQTELSFTGIGESTLHPEFCGMLISARNACPNIPIVFSTNGLPSFHEGIAKCCAEYDVGVMISTHRPEMAGKAVELSKKYGILKYINTQFVDGAFDWAGQVEDWFVSAPDNIVCEYLRSGWGVVLFDGQITTCCLDSENLGVVGTVDTDPRQLQLKPYSLCETCHMHIPQ